MDCTQGYNYNLFDYEMAVGMGFRFESTSVYGLAERESSLYIQSTLDREPYRFFNCDYYGHKLDDSTGEYGSVPYVTAHNKENDVSLLWVNSADTWSEVIPIPWNN